MNFTTHRSLRTAALAFGAAPNGRHRLLVASLAATIGVGVSTPVSGAAMAADGGGLPRDLRVGHMVQTIDVPGSFCMRNATSPDCKNGENRPVDVHLWYPADVSGFVAAPKTVYTSWLYGKALTPGPWDPLSWRVESEVAHENAPIDPNGPAFPVIVFSHGSTNDPIDYAQTLELIAGAGFVVAAPAHVNNTQDDERIDFINTQADMVQKGLRLFDCRDGRPSPCSRGNIPRSMEDRVRDISYTLDKLDKDKLGHWSLADRIDLSHVGVMGHSRGTVTALASAGGSSTWDFRPDKRVDAVMGLAIGAQAITSAVDLANVTVPTLLVAGQLDQNSVHRVSEFAFGAIRSEEKAYVLLTNAVHRSFDSSYCDELKSAGAITEAAGTDAQGKPTALLDWHTVRLIGTSFPGGLSGVAHEYCSADAFSNPDLTGLMRSFNGLPYVDGQGRPTGKTFTFSPGAPTTGLETDEVKNGVTDLAVTFFGTVLKRVGNDGPHFTRFLAPRWLEKHEPMVGKAEAFAGADAICPPGQGMVCGD